MLSNIWFTEDSSGNIFPVWDLRSWIFYNTCFASCRWKSQMLGPLFFFFFFPDFFPCESQHEPRAGDRATMGREKGWGEAGWVDALSGQGVLGCRDLSAGEYDSRGNSCLMVKEQRKSWVGVRKESRKPQQPHWACIAILPCSSLWASHSVFLEEIDVGKIKTTTKMLC